jgi:hypothetical protein
MFPFTQLYDLYNWYYYEEIKCSNPTCNVKFLSRRSNPFRATHCSVGCGYAHHAYDEELRKKERETTEYKLFREYCKNKIREEQTEKLKNELILKLLDKKEEMKEELVNEVRMELNEKREDILKDLLNKAS